jgi:hypothetical protein
MRATDVIHQLQKLLPEEVAKVQGLLVENGEDSPELLAAIDMGLQSLETKGARVVNREEMESKVRRWAGGSR